MTETKFDFSRFHPLDHHFWQCWERNRYSPIYGRMLVHLEYMNAYGERGLWFPTPRWVWHKLMCRLGHHDIQGGETIKIGKLEHKVIRCCVWCWYEPELETPVRLYDDMDEEEADAGMRRLTLRALKLEEEEDEQ